MKLETCSINYAVKLTLKQFDKLESWNFDKQNKLITEMHDTGATSIDWNGHFGPHVFFTHESDPQPTLQVLKKWLTR